jgi:hypothetical protein
MHPKPLFLIFSLGFTLALCANLLPTAEGEIPGSAVADANQPELPQDLNSLESTPLVESTDGTQPELAPSLSLEESEISEPVPEEPTGQLLESFEDKFFDLSFNFRQGYDSNVFTDNVNPYESLYSNLGFKVDYNFDAPQLSLETSTSAGLTYYYSVPDYQLEANASFAAILEYRLSQRATISLITSTSFLPQPDLATPGLSNQYNESFVYSTTTLGFNYLWSQKVATETKYNFTPVYYLEDAYNDIQGRVEQTLSQSVQWLLNPKSKVLLEYRANPVLYYSAPLDNFGQFALLGWDQTLNPRSKVNVRLGAEQRFYDSENNNRTYIGPFGELIGTYQYQKFSTLNLNLRYGTEASGIGGSATRDTFRIGFGAVHGITPKLSFNASVNYQNNYYNEFDKNVNYPDFSENVIQFSFGANFKINEKLSLEAGYSYTNDSAPGFIADALAYERNIAFVGVKATY